MARHPYGREKKRAADLEFKDAKGGVEDWFLPPPTREKNKGKRG